MKKVVFTNGCFDILHPGHIDLLNKAKLLGNHLIVGINSDKSIKKIKGNDRPYLSQQSRKEMLLALKSVDEVHIFEELTPIKLIQHLRPNILVKGGDWKVEEIIGAEFVFENGGEVFSIPLTGNFSTSNLVNIIKTDKQNGLNIITNDGICETSIHQHNKVFQDILENNLEVVKDCANLIVKTLKRGNKILLCGNGGSAADAQHIAAELVGRFESERRAFPAISLTTDTSALTALANDYDFERIFSRQVEALAVEGDCLIAISTSGNSKNVIAAVMKAREKGCSILGMTGSKGKKLASLSDECLMIPSDRTARIQEAHITIAHIWCEIVDSEFEGNN